MLFYLGFVEIIPTFLYDCMTSDSYHWNSESALSGGSAGPSWRSQDQNRLCHWTNSEESTATFQNELSKMYGCGSAQVQYFAHKYFI